MNKWQKFVHFVEGVFSDNGSPSWSRISGGLILTAVIAWVTYLVLRNNTLPDLTGPTILITGGGGGMYGLNRLPDMLAAFRGNPPTQQKQEAQPGPGN